MIRQVSKHFLGALLIASVVVSLTSCVTQREGAFSSDADKQEAENAYVRLGLAYIQDENYGRARRHLDRALEINDESAPALAAKALISQEQGEYQLAESRFRQALEYDSDYTRGRSHFGVFLYNQERYEEALEQFRQASKDTDFEGRAGVFVNLGRAANKLERHGEAANAYKRAMQLDRGNLRAHLGAVAALVDAGRYDEARPLFDQLKARIRRSGQTSHTPRSLWAGIRIAQHEGDQDEVASLALQLRKRFPDSEEHRKYRSMKTDD
jgi:type IV pilus assembly protein PilF